MLHLPGRLGGTLVAALVAWFVVPAVDAGEIFHYRFEDSPGFLIDSSGNGNTLVPTGTPTQATLPGSGRGSTFSDPIPLTGDANDRAAEFDAAVEHLDVASLSGLPGTWTGFTLEAFFHLDTTSSTTNVIAEMLSGGPTALASLQIRTNGFNGTDPAGEIFAAISDGPSNNEYFNSGFNSTSTPVLTTGRDYYVALRVVDDGVTPIDFLLQDLTAGGPLTTSSVPTTISAGGLVEGAFPLIISYNLAAAVFDGLIDEIRFSDEALPDDQLLITQAQTSSPATVLPEPSTLLLYALGGLLAVAAAAWRRHRGRGQAIAA